ncbi:MAG TPA: hypothetical protein VGJ92_07910 [Methanocella sp.]|jgi:hypothetical protein
MAADDFSVELPPVEDLEGGGSRTRHVILKRSGASLSQSAFSCRIGDKIAPNRDYPYEGLYVLLDGDNWKFIDVFAFGACIGDRWLDLKPKIVRASPWDCEYTYEADGLLARLKYRLFAVPDGAGILDVSLTGKQADETTIVLEPFFDIRFMYDRSLPDTHHADVIRGTLAVGVGTHTACLTAKDAIFVRKGRRIPWKYKLGSGNRCWQYDRLRFVPETRIISSFYDIEMEGPEASLRFACGETAAIAFERLEGEYDDNDLARATLIRNTLFPHYTWKDRDVLFRALGADRFGMMVDGVRFREAGDFWFRSVWFRDLFEGLIHNYQTTRKVDGMDGMEEALLKSFDLQDDQGRIPNRLVPGTGSLQPDYNSADATLLAFILAGMLVRDGCGGDLAQSAAAAFRRYLVGIRCCNLEANGPPRLRPGGLISVPSWHSWTDGMRSIDGYTLPIRVTEDWERELIRRNATEELFLQKFFLPEINAQWMRALEAGWRFSRYDRDFAMADTCKMYYNRARDAFRQVFLDQRTGYINNLACTDDFALGPQSDPTPGSPGVVAAAMLGQDVFTLRELEGIAAFARARLLRTKWGMPFGIIVRESEREVYLGDPEYHEAVVWPRDTPYLIRLLELTGDRTTVAGLLASNLRHQMEEGFLFYNHELFSGDDDRVPVKNPVQWWSQWVDPYLNRGLHG